MKKVYKRILKVFAHFLDAAIFGWAILWCYHNINFGDSRWLADIGAAALLLIVTFAYACITAGRLYKKPIYDQLSYPDREQVRTEFYDQRHDAEIRRREDQEARERTHKEKEKRDAQEAIRLLYEHLPERVQIKSIILRNELEGLGEYHDQDLAGTEDLTAIRAPIPRFSSKESSLLWSMSDKIADAIINLALQNHAAETGEPEIQVSASALCEYRYKLRREVRRDAKAHLTDLDRYYYTPATPMWRAEDFKRYGSLEED